MKKCSKCGSTNVMERDPKDGRKRWVCNDCGYKMIAKSESSKSISENFKTDIDKCISFVKSINSSNYKQKLFNTKMIYKYVYVVVVLVIALCSYFVGLNTIVNERLLATKDEYKIMIDDYHEAVNEYREISDDLPKMKAELASNSDLLHEMKDYKKNQETYSSEINSLKDEISELKTEKSELTNDISDLTAEKKELTKEIAIAKGKGYTLTAGKYVGGEDIPVGTYNINWKSGSGNVVVRSATGKLSVNEIFGNKSAYGYIKTYKNCYVAYGTEIEISSNLKIQFKAKE